MRRILFGALVAVAVMGVLAPRDAEAQRRGGRAVVRGAVGVGRVHYRPVYRPYYFGVSYYRPYFWGAYGWYPYGFYPFYPYPYPYPYYGFMYDTRSSTRIQVTPREAEVYVDGAFVGLVDDFDGFSQRLSLPPGEHVIEIHLDGYRPIQERRLFRPRASYKIQQTMQPLPAGEPTPPRPKPSAEAPPPSAGAPYGQEPRDRDRWEPRPPRESARRSDPDSTYGTLTIRTRPADAEILVDGEPWERSSGDGPLTLDLAPGTHRIEVRREGHRTFVKEVEVRAGDSETLNVSLSRE